MPFMYGPYDIPQKDEWVIVGSGPSANDLPMLLSENPDIGIITVSSIIQVLDRVDVLVHSHYEDYVTSLGHFDKASLIFLPDPSHVGYRCVPVDPANLFDKRYLDKKWPGKIRFYRKERNLQFATGNPSLFLNHTVATVCLHLLALNGVRKAYVLGIDGGFERADNFKDIYKEADAHTLISYDKHRDEFFEFAKDCGIKICLIKNAKSPKAKAKQPLSL